MREEGRAGWRAGKGDCLPAAVAFPVRIRTWVSSSVIRRWASSATLEAVEMEAPQLWHAWVRDGAVEGGCRIATEDMSWQVAGSR